MPITARLRVQKKATRHDTRQQNRRLVLQCMMAEGSTSRADIARSTGLTAATVSDLVGQLIDEGLVQEVGTGPSAGGKPPTLLDLNATARSVIAVDLSDGARTASIVDLKGEPTLPATRHDEVPRGQAGVDDLIATIDDLVASNPTPLLGIGIGSPGVVDGEGTVIEASNLGWRDIPLGTLLSDRFGVPVHIINNSRSAALAEYAYGEHQAENMLVIKIGNGIGAGVVLDGRIHGGEDSAAGEIGHVVVDINGPECFCGKRGCLETVAAVPYLASRLRPLLPEAPPETRGLFEHAEAAAGDGNVEVNAVIEEAARHLAKVLTTTIAVLDVHRVVITGTVSALGQPLLSRIGTEIEQAILPALAAKLDLCYGHTGDRAVRLGASALVLNRELGVA